MKPDCLETVAALRLIVGYLGEKAQHNWWKSSFFAQGSDSFLVPLFPKTTVLARIEGVTAAAAAVHDAQVGEGNAYHLFRLPEEQEYALHRYLQEKPSSLPFSEVATDAADALNYLRTRAAGEIPVITGPTRVGTVADVRNQESWSLVAACYVAGYLQGRLVLPYFSGVA